MKIEAGSSLPVGSNARITVAANQGGRKYMEDRVNIETIRNEDGSVKFTFLGVFDGHGGMEASDFVRKNLLGNIMACETFESENDNDILAAIKEGFLTTHEEMTKVVGTWPRTASGYESTAGTTSSVAIIRNGKLYTGHVGDSAIIIGSYRALPDGKFGVDVERVTIDHKPESLEEMTRIELAGGRVAVKSGVSRVVWTRPARGHVGPIKKNTPTESIPFLAVARSLGDLWSYCEATGQYVVSPEPDLAVRKLTDADSCIVIVSDGITNVLSHQQIVQYVELEEKKLVINDEQEADPTELREKQPNHARVILYQAMRRWGNLRADNLSAVVVVFDPVTADIDAYNPFFDEILSPQQSVDEMFLMDPEAMIHLAPGKMQKLWTERVPLLYEGAVDNNFVSVDYRGPGFLTHDEEEEIEARLLMKEKLRESFKEKSSPVIELDETVEFNDEPCPETKENLIVTSTLSTVVKSSNEGSNEDDEDSHSDEEEPTDLASGAATELTSTTPPPITIAPKTRSAAKRIMGATNDDQTTPARKIAVAARRVSLIKTDTNVGIASITVEAVTVSGVITRSRERNQNPINDVIATPSTSQTPVRSMLYMENGSRKRPSRMTAGSSAGITPFVGRMRIEGSPVMGLDEEHPVMRSEPSTPAKEANSPVRASKWSLSKLDELRGETVEHYDFNEPPSKIRRIYGFMKRLVGLGNN